MENRQNMSNSNEPSHNTTQRNSTQQSQPLQLNNSLEPCYNPTFFTLQGSNISVQDIPSEIPHLGPFTFDFFRHRQPLLRSNFRPQIVPIFHSSDLNFFSPYSLQSLPNQNLNNLSFLQNIEPPRFIQYNSLSPHFIRRVDDTSLLPVTSQVTTPFIPTSRFRALPFTTISPVSLPSVASLESSIVLEPLDLAISSSTIRLPTSTTSNEGLTESANMVTISIPVQTEPTDEKKRDIIESPKRKSEKEMLKDPRKKSRRPSSTFNDTMDNDNVSIIREATMTLDSEREREVNKETGEQSLRRSVRIAGDKQKRVLFYETLSQLSKKRKRMDESDSNDKAKPDELPKRRRGRPRKNEQKPNGRPRGRQPTRPPLRRSKKTPMN
ncbi:13833_t:CDS:2 [Funneliformis caledonium]|uniref:13833_t:CDS:1 n=1 Tax=Funneliformis caledonium TaxID=1117310 RepID=A0A9N8YYD3_9GLOM|nr:13833_t:CDS:2 [Funneliformis caledonium]